MSYHLILHIAKQNLMFHLDVTELECEGILSICIKTRGGSTSDMFRFLHCLQCIASYNYHTDVFHSERKKEPVQYI